MEILLVEDSLLDARFAIEALRRGDLKHRLTLVRDGAEALEFLRQEGRFAQAPRPDLILLDVELPKKSGREVLAEVKADEKLCTIPVVIMTSHSSPQEAFGDEPLDVESYMTKPVDLDQFLSVVKELKRFWLSEVILPNID